MSGIREFIPPILLEALRPGKPEPHPSYAAARAACEGRGYEQGALIETIRRKNLAYRDELAAAATPFQADAATTRLFLALTRAMRGEALTVIDFGGAAGTHYFQARAFFGPAVRLRWHVVETPAMVAMARANFASEELSFHEDLAAARAAAGDADLTLASSVLPYVPEPEATLAALVEAGSRWLYIARQGVVPADRHVYVAQRSRLSANGPGPMPADLPDGETAYVATYMPRARLEAAIARRYDVRLVIEEFPRLLKADGLPIPSLAWLAERRAGEPT